MTPKLPKSTKNALLRPKPVFGAKITFGAQSVKKSNKVRKERKWAPKHQRNHCLEQGLRDGREINACDPKKRSFSQKVALLRPKRVLGGFLRFLRQK